MIYLPYLRIRKRKTKFFLYYKSWNNWKHFSPRLSPPYLSQKPHCQAKKPDERDGEIDFVNVYHQNPIIFYTSNFLYTPLVPTYYFPLADTYFPLHIHRLIIDAIFSFGRIIINIIVYEKKRKTCIIFRRKINDIDSW